MGLKSLLIKLDGLIGAYEDRSANDKDTCSVEFDLAKREMAKMDVGSMASTILKGAKGKMPKGVTEIDVV